MIIFSSVHLKHLLVLSSRLLQLHHETSWLTCLHAKLSPSCVKPVSVVSSANFRSFTDAFLKVQSLVYRKRGNGDHMQPCAIPVLRVRESEMTSLTCCFLPFRKSVMQWHVALVTDNCESLMCNRGRIIVLTSNQ